MNRIQARSLRNPLGRARGLGSAKAGTEHFWHQRLTAVALIPLVLIFATMVLRLVGADHATTIATLGYPPTAGIAVLLIVAGFWHLQLGVQVVIEDYVHGDAVKLMLKLATTFTCVVVGLAALFAVLRMALAV
jgi:succinate dehydrogenase / fumarate reductase membrane anchor subunit